MVKKFRYYLGWKKFLVRTDHRPLLQLRTFQVSLEYFPYKSCCDKMTKNIFVDMRLPRALCFNFVYFQPPSCFETRLFNMLCTYDFDIEYREVSGGKNKA